MEYEREGGRVGLREREERTENESKSRPVVKGEKSLRTVDQRADLRSLSIASWIDKEPDDTFFPPQKSTFSTIYFLPTFSQ